MHPLFRILFINNCCLKNEQVKIDTWRSNDARPLKDIARISTREIDIQ